MQDTPLPEIIRACREIAYQNRPDGGQCFELFRRAFDDEDQAAWSALQEQYQGLVKSWLSRRAADLLETAVIEDLTQETFLRFWRTLNRHKQPIAERFEHVGGLLRYLHQCAVSSLLDMQRRQERLQRARVEARQSPEDVPHAHYHHDLDSRIDDARQIEKVRHWISVYVTEPDEQLVLRLSFEEGLSPSEISQCHPRRFPTARAVRRVKERLVKRARRALADE